LDNLLEQIKRLFAAEYARGDRDAIARIMQAAQGDAAAENTKELPARRVRITLTHRRALRGAADSLIKRVLGERRYKGAGALEIQQSALSPAEKAVSYSGLRFALDRGRGTGIYRNKNGKWFLTETKAAEHQHAAE
jgi:hypothetical protein